jgi:hypothetical protein
LGLPVVGADYDFLAAKRYTEIVEVNGLRLEGIRFEGAFWCILRHQLVNSKASGRKHPMLTHRTTISDAIRSDNTEAELEKMRDLVSPAH